MMKKQAYMKPTMKVVTIRTQNHLLVLSGDYVKEGEAGGGENLGRQTDFWDDDDDF